MKFKRATYLVTIPAVLAFTTLTNAQMKGPGRQGELMCPGMQGHAGLMHDSEVSLSVTESANGVTFEWTSKNPEKVKALKEMATRMKTMHETQIKPSSKK